MRHIWFISFLVIWMNAQGQWGLLGVGTDRWILEMYHDSTMGRLYAVGAFQHAGGQVVNSTAWWDGQFWHPMGGGITPYFIPAGAVTVFGGDVIVGGNFFQVDSVPNTRGIAKWDSGNWSALGSGISGMVNRIYNNGTSIYVGGYIDSIGSTVARGIARYDGSQWHGLLNGQLGNNFDLVTAITEYQGELIVGGNFNQTFPGEVGRIVNDSLVLMGSGILGDAWVNDLVVFQGELYMAGEFYTGAGNAASCLMKWDGNDWIDAFPGVEFLTQVKDFDVHNGELFMSGGRIRISGSPDLYNIARSDGQQICLFGPGNYSAQCIEGMGDSLYIAIGGVDTTQYYANWIFSYDLSHPSDTCINVTVSINGPDDGLDGPGWTMMPNPASDGLTISLVNDELRAKGPQVHIYDPQGRLVRQYSLGGSTGAVHHLPLDGIGPGPYLVQLFNAYRPQGDAQRLLIK